MVSFQKNAVIKGKKIVIGGSIFEVLWSISGFSVSRVLHFTATKSKELYKGSYISLKLHFIIDTEISALKISLKQINL